MNVIFKQSFDIRVYSQQLNHNNLYELVILLIPQRFHQFTLKLQYVYSTSQNENVCRYLEQKLRIFKSRDFSTHFIIGLVVFLNIRGLSLFARFFYKIDQKMRLVEIEKHEPDDKCLFLIFKLFRSARKCKNSCGVHCGNKLRYKVILLKKKYKDNWNYFRS